MSFRKSNRCRYFFLDHVTHAWHIDKVPPRCISHLSVVTDGAGDKGGTESLRIAHAKPSVAPLRCTMEGVSMRPYDLLAELHAHTPKDSESLQTCAAKDSEGRELATAGDVCAHGSRPESEVAGVVHGVDCGVGVIATTGPAERQENDAESGGDGLCRTRTYVTAPMFWTIEESIDWFEARGITEMVLYRADDGSVRGRGELP